MRFGSRNLLMYFCKQEMENRRVVTSRVSALIEEILTETDGSNWIWHKGAPEAPGSFLLCVGGGQMLYMLGGERGQALAGSSDWATKQQQIKDSWQVHDKAWLALLTLTLLSVWCYFMCVWTRNKTSRRKKKSLALFIFWFGLMRPKLYFWPHGESGSLQRWKWQSSGKNTETLRQTDSGETIPALWALQHVDRTAQL